MNNNWVIYLFLGMLFVVNLFLRVRLMKLHKPIRQNQILINWKQVISKSKAQDLIDNNYPEHEELIHNYTGLMRQGIYVLITLFIGLAIWAFVQ